MKIFFDATQHVPIHSWTDRVDALSLARLRTLARWDVLSGPIAVMPDVHPAEEVCVGTVLATRDFILPTAIGQDLGCGMNSQCFDLAANDLSRRDLERIVAKIICLIPVGRVAHRKPQVMPEVLRSAELSTKMLSHTQHWLGARHFATLGGGNHFIELQGAPDGRLWATVHSGSRGIGAAIANHHARIAALHKKGGPLPCFEADTESARAFWNDLQYALVLAAENRIAMQRVVASVLRQFTGRSVGEVVQFDVAHNTITRETYDGHSLIIHRKGAMPATAGVRGIIPGSMGTASYLVEGLGNAASYNSCSHGAGRKLSRSAARQQIDRREFARQTAHIVLPQTRNVGAFIEETPAAYKDIKEVLDQQRDLVRKVARLLPLAVVKG
jgi:tRNA-splicing ligase RtcB (3'-phosphate/5'-hydroxy nucleic acid ligase)